MEQQMMNQSLVHISLEELCRCEDIQQDILITVVEYGIAKPVEGSEVSEWVFDTRSVYWIKKALRLHHDLELDWIAVSMVTDLLQQKDKWKKERSHLHRQLARFIHNDE
jgi:chaperone modulatory protein CbpM